MITIYDWFGYEISIEERYRLIKEAGFDGILMWWSDAFGRGTDYRQGPELARKAGLIIENIHTPMEYQNHLWLDNLEGKASLECYLQCVRDCAEFEIPAMVVHLPDDSLPCNELGLNRIKEIAQEAEKLNINVALENLGNFRNLFYVLDGVDSSRMGFCYDCGHHYNYCPEEDLLSRYGSRLMALHLHDVGGEQSMHQIPFDGPIEWETVMKNIRETGYSGAVAIEAMNWDYMDISAKEYLRRAFESGKRLESLIK